MRMLVPFEIGIEDMVLPSLQEIGLETGSTISRVVLRQRIRVSGITDIVGDARTRDS